MKTISLILLSIIFFTACDLANQAFTVPNCGDDMKSVPTWYCTNAGSSGRAIVTDVKYICPDRDLGSICIPPDDIYTKKCFYTAAYPGGAAKSPHNIVLKCVSNSNIIVDTTPGEPNSPYPRSN